jgi:hypothetical protein
MKYGVGGVDTFEEDLNQRDSVNWINYK